MPDTEVIVVAHPSPVFVDSTGRRGRLLRRVAYAFGALCVVYGGLISISLAGGPVSSSAVLPLPDLADRKATEKAVVARPSPTPEPVTTHAVAQPILEAFPRRGAPVTQPRQTRAVTPRTSATAPRLIGTPTPTPTRSRPGTTRPTKSTKPVKPVESTITKSPTPDVTPSIPAPDSPPAPPAPPAPPTGSANGQGGGGGGGAADDDPDPAPVPPAPPAITGPAKPTATTEARHTPKSKPDPDPEPAEQDESTEPAEPAEPAEEAEPDESAEQNESAEQDEPAPEPSDEDAP